MSVPETILAVILGLGVVLTAWRIGQPMSAQPTTARRRQLFLQVFLRALVALTPFVAIAVAVIVWGIVPLAGPTGLTGALGAMITGTVVAVGWVASAAASEFRQAIERDVTRRDTLIALRSEIMTFVETLDRSSIVQDGYRVLSRIRQGDGEADGKPVEYYPFSTSDSDPVILQAVSANVPALRDETVEVIVRFYAQLTDMKALVQDSRSDAVRDLSRKRRVALHAILVRRRLEVLRRGLIAIVAINEDLDFPNPSQVFERSGENPEVTFDAESMEFDTDDERAFA